MKVSIEFGVLSPPLSEQLGIDADRLEHLQACCDAVNRLAINGVLSEAEKDRVRRRLVKRIVKVVQKPSPSPPPRHREGRRAMSEKPAYAGAAWLRNMGVEPSPLGEAVANIIGFVWRGIYHLTALDLDASDFTDPHLVQVRVPDGLATFDHGYLTELVVLCYSNRLRMEIKPRGRRHLLLRFHEPAFEMPLLDPLADKIRRTGPRRGFCPSGATEGGADAG